MGDIPASVWIIVVLAAVVLDLGLMRFMRHILQSDSVGKQVRVFGVYSPTLTWLRYRRPPVLAHGARATAWPRVRWALVAELTVIVVWALWVGRRYLNLDSNVWISAGDWPLNLETYFSWTLLKQCGACVMWNGLINGGAPAFVELVGAIVHPVMVIGILLVGVTAASKLAVVAGLIMAGLAQWWIAKVLRVGLIPSLWTAGMAVVGGHLSGRMNNGLVEDVLAVGACSLALAAGLDLAFTGRRRALVAFGVLLGLSVLAGQGYMQIALVVGILPGFAIFLFNRQLKIRPLWRSFLWAGIIATLISAVLLVPFLHFYPNFNKPTTDPEFTDVPSLNILLYNLVNRDPEFYWIFERGGKPLTPAWYVNYIGWIPLLLGAVALRQRRPKRVRFVLFCLVGLGLLYLFASAIALRWLAAVAPNLVTSLRTPSVMTSLAIPLILGLAACGLDELLKLNWPSLSISQSNAAVGAISLKWFILAVPLIWSLKTAYDFGWNWMHFVDSPVPFYPIFDSVNLDRQQWVAPPFGESELAVVGLQSNLKLTEVVRPWKWRDREFPPANFELTRSDVDTSSPNYLGEEYGLRKVVHPDRQYAFVQSGSEMMPCQAVARGGNIDVDCQNAAAGNLLVYENSWSGWSVRRDGERAALGPGQWLSTPAPAGQHHYEFRYRPWDVPLGVVLSLIGVWVSFRLWFSAPGARATRSKPRSA